MNCKNCGGAMELVATRGYFFCRYCGSFHFPESAADGGIKVLGDLRTPSPCVVCRQPLTSATLDDTHDVRYCRNCRGALLRRTSFAGVVEQRSAWALDTPEPPVRSEPLRARPQGLMPGLHAGDGDSSLLRAGKRRHRQLRFLRAGLARFRRARADRQGTGQGSRNARASSTGRRRQPGQRCRRRTCRCGRYRRG